MRRFATDVLPNFPALVYVPQVKFILLCSLSVAVCGCGNSAPVTPQSATGSPAPAAGSSAAESNPAKGEPHSAGAAKTPAARAKPPATPSAEQLTKWGIPEYQPLQLLTCYDGFGDAFVQSLAVSPDGKQFALGGAKLTLWNTADSKPTVDLVADYKEDEFERPIRCIAISPDGHWLASGDQKGTVRIWDLGDQSKVITFKAHEGHLTQLAFTPNSQTLATTSYSGEVRLWQASDGKKLKSFKVSDQELHGLVFISDQRLACAGKETSIWNSEQGTKELVLSTEYVRGPALGLTRDRSLLAFGDADAKVQLWDVEQPAVAPGSTLNGGAGLIKFSRDGKWIATYSGDYTIRIWDVATRRTVQVIDADGGRTADFSWLPEADLLLIASERGRVRIWGTPEAAESAGLQILQLPVPATTSAPSKKPLNPAQLRQVIDIRALPMLPGAVPQWGQFYMAAYKTPSSVPEAELFYRYLLAKSGWQETTTGEPSQPGLEFRKADCVLNVTLTPPSVPVADGDRDLQVSLNWSGNYDVRWLPKFSELDSKNTWGAFSSVSYRTKAELTDVEVALLKQFHELGWTAYSRLAASGTEEPASRTFSMLQGGSELTVSIRPPADAPGELAVQTSVHVLNKSLPIPPDSGWIEFDSSTNLQLVANTAMDLERTVAFFDTEMAAQGWLAREAGRHIQDGNAWLPYLCGQQDVLIRLVPLPDDRTRIIVGEAESSSWQLKKPSEVAAEKQKPGIEAADFPVPTAAKSVKFDVDEKQIEFELAGITPPVVAEQFAKQLAADDWKRESAGVLSDEYTYITLIKAKAEIQIRARAANPKLSTVTISGDGLLWSKPLPTRPVRISYETWLRRNHFEASLNRLDEFSAEMHKIPVAAESR